MSAQAHKRIEKRFIIWKKKYRYIQRFNRVKRCVRKREREITKEKRDHKTREREREIRFKRET